MWSRVKRLRFWETVFLLLALDSTGSIGLTFGIEFAAGPTTEPGNPSTAIVGYVLAAIATWYQRKTASKLLLWLSAALALAGITTSLGELIRYFGGYGFRIVAFFGICQVLLDWAIFKTDKKLASEPWAKW